ncbi:MAG: class F sortase [Acidimicrobiales bacterium]
MAQAGAHRLPASGDLEAPSPSEHGPEALAQSAPSWIRIPAIGVMSGVRALGLSHDGELEVPAPGALYDDPAWYRYSPTPGSPGPAVISGHRDSAASGPSIFYRLGELRRGDRILVGRADGTVAVFSVDGVREYSKDHFPTRTVYGDTDRAALRLLTCAGAFDHSSGRYLDNLVVFATLVGTAAAG